MNDITSLMTSLFRPNVYCMWLRCRNCKEATFLQIPKGVSVDKFKSNTDQHCRYCGLNDWE